MYKHSNIGKGVFWDNSKTTSAVTTNSTAFGTLLGDFAPYIHTSVQTAADRMEFNLHMDFATAEAPTSNANTSIFGRLSIPDNVVGDRPFMIEVNGFCSAQETTLRVVPIPVIVCEANAWTLSSGWATSAQTNSYKILPYKTYRTTGGYQSLVNCRVVVDQNADSDEPLAIGWLLQNHSGGTAAIAEANAQMVARYALERIETFDREF